MTEQQGAGWQPPARDPGPAPGVEFAPFGPRLVAYIIDAVIVGVVVTIIMVAAVVFGVISGDVAVGQRPGAEFWAVLGAAILVVTVIAVGYFPWFWSRDGATPGMKMFGLQVVRDDDGGPIGFGTGIVRVIGMWLSSAVMYVGFIWVFIDRRRRGWHDLIAGTVVVKRP